MKNDDLVLENTKDEMILIVDENDNIIGESTRIEMVFFNWIYKLF